MNQATPIQFFKDTAILLSANSWIQAGIFIMADAPYKIGDYIVMDNGTRGQA